MAREPVYEEDIAVEVYDVARRRWYKATTRCCVLWEEDTGKEGWECQLRNGSIGNFDTKHMRRTSA
jgi:hypothetical protein